MNTPVRQNPWSNYPFTTDRTTSRKYRILTGYHRVLNENSESQKGRCNIIIKSLRESASEVAEERKLYDESLMEKIRNQVGLQEKPVKIMRLGEKKHSNPEPDYSRPESCCSTEGRLLPAWLIGSHISTWQWWRAPDMYISTSVFPQWAG